MKTEKRFFGMAVLMACLIVLASCGGDTTNIYTNNPNNQPTYSNQFDLSVTGITFSTSQVGVIGNLDVTVTNFGMDITNSTGLASFTSNLASTGFVFEPGFGTVFVPQQAYPTTGSPLRQLGTFVYRVRGYFPVVGTTQVSFTTDAGNTLTEANENNNILTAPITVSQGGSANLSVTLGINYMTSANTATISWTAAANDTYVVYYGTNPSSLNLATGAVTSGTGGYQVNLTGLSSGATYYYSIQLASTGQHTAATQLVAAGLSAPSGAPVMSYLPGASNVEIGRVLITNRYGENVDLRQAVITPTCGANYASNMRLVNAATNAVISPTLVSAGGSQWSFGSLNEPIAANNGTYTLAVRADIASNAPHNSTCSYTFSNVTVYGNTSHMNLPAAGNFTGNTVTIQ
jgi:hypothetical protein